MYAKKCVHNIYARNRGEKGGKDSEEEEGGGGRRVREEAKKTKLKQTGRGGGVARSSISLFTSREN